MKKAEEFPVQIKFSLYKIVDKLISRIKNSDTDFLKSYMESMLGYAQSFPELIDGVSDFKELEKYVEPIHLILENLFPAALSANEIKAACIPFHNVIFNPTQHFSSILENAGPDFELEIRNFDDETYYIYTCVVILNNYYGYNIDLNKPLYYDIPEKNGLLRHYRITMNYDFVTLEPTDQAVDVTSEMFKELIQNFDNITLWKKYFPPNSWVMRGLTILTLTDVTIDDAISELKSNLLSQSDIDNLNGYPKFEEIFRSIFDIADLKVGFTELNFEDRSFIKMDKDFASSYILDKENKHKCNTLLCKDAYNALVIEKTYFSIADVEAYAVNTDYNLLSENLLAKGIKSCILAPLAKGKKLLAVLEIVSIRKNELHSINAIKLDDVTPYIVSTIERMRYQKQNRIKAVIQSECTSIHPSVLWVFEREARRFIALQGMGRFAAFRDIAFNDVYPLYGQIDMIGSSEQRNKAIQKDILMQLNMVSDILKLAFKLNPLPIYEQVLFRVSEYTDSISDHLSASSESEVIKLLQNEVNPFLNHLKSKFYELSHTIDNYKAAINKDSGLIYDHRKTYDEIVEKINLNLATFIDNKQQDAQKKYPHYFERYKTDGVDHNMYIGESMTRSEKFSEIYLYNLRLWQLSTMCEMENHFYQIQKDDTFHLDAASLILVYSRTLTIRYRMDEKKFDIDGSYNARYEIIKKRIDKAFISGTTERITQKGKIAIVYTQDSDAEEYMRYIKYLQFKNYLGNTVEDVKLEDVQGVVGLRALRVEVVYNYETKIKKSRTANVTYEELMKVLN